MASRPDEPADAPAHDALGALDGPADDELEFSGPGQDDEDARSLLGGDLPGGVDHTTAAAGAGVVGVALLGIAGVLKRRRARRRYGELDE